MKRNVEEKNAYVQPECKTYKVMVKQLIATSQSSGSAEGLDEEDKSSYFGN